MKSKILPDRKNIALCNDCDDCCRHVAVEIDKPTSKTDYSNIIWYLLHKNVNVFIDHSNSWFIEFLTKCSKLNGRRLCDDYEDRPKICRGYAQKDCVKYGEGKAEKVYFRTKEQFIRYLKKKGIDYRFKR